MNKPHSKTDGVDADSLLGKRESRLEERSKIPLNELAERIGFSGQEIEELDQIYGEVNNEREAGSDAIN